MPVAARADAAAMNLRPRYGDLLALVAGLALPLAFAPFGLFPLAIAAPALLLWLWRGATPRRALWRGALFGAGLFGVGVNWVHVSIHVYGHSSLAVAIGLAALLAAYLALFPALTGWLYARLFPRGGRLAELAAFPALWVLGEWLRGWLFTGFPWLWLGYSQTDTPLGQLAPLTGVLGVSWACALSAALLLTLFRGPHATPRLAAALGVTLLWAASALIGRVEWTEPAGAPVEVALLQGNVDQDLKWSVEERRGIIDRYLELTRQNWDRPVIIWPETALPAFRHQVPKTLEELDAEAKSHGAGVLVGLPVMDADERYYNSLLAVGDGDGLYRKRHLVPFGDYLPLAGLLRGLINFFDLPMSSFSAGAPDQPPLRVNGLTLAPSVCYEIAFPDEVRSLLPAAQVLVNVSNDAWFGTSIGPHQHFQIARMRALETGRWLLRATNTGITAIVDHRGRVQRRAPQFQTGALTGSAEPRAGATPFVRTGTLPVATAALLLLVAAWAGARHLRSRPPRLRPTPAPERPMEIPD